MNDRLVSTSLDDYADDHGDSHSPGLRAEEMTGDRLTVRLLAAFVLFASMLVGAVPEARIDPQTIRLPMADGKDLRFTRISTADGLSQTRVSQIVQDDRGFMWFGTQYGLNRYDGYKFKVFVHDPHRSNSLGGVFITSLFKDRSGALWVGCGQLLDRFDPITESFKHYRVESEGSDILTGTVVHISQDRAGMLWLATGTGLHRFDPATGNIRHYRHDPNDASSLESNDVKWTGEDRHGSLWVGTSLGLDTFDRETGKTTFHIPLPDAVGTSFYEDRAGVFWILYASGTGLAVLDRTTNRVTRYSFYDHEPARGALTGIMAMLEDREGNLWLGSPEVGLLRFDRQGHRFLRYRNNPGNPESLAEDKVIALCEDREGNVWAGLHSMGPNHFSPKPSPFETFRHVPANPNSLAINFVNAIFEDHEGILWIGNDDALNRIDRKSGRYTFFSAGLGLKPMVIAITEDHAGTLWVGTFGHGVNRFDRRTGTFTTYRNNPQDPSSLSDDEVHRLFVDHAGTLWVGTDDGLDRFDPLTGRFKVYKLDWRSRRSQSYVSIAEDRAGKLWLGTHYSGLHRFDPIDGKFTVYKSNPNGGGSLTDNMVPSIHIDSSGTIWVGTQNGLDRLDQNTNTVTSYDERDGLAGNAVNCILEDSRGFLWAGTNKGLSEFDPRNKRFKNYSSADGLPGNDLTGWSACFKSPSGEMFVGGFPGAAAFRPENIDDSSYVPTVVLTDFTLSGNRMEVGPNGPLKASVSYAAGVTLPHDQNNFSLEFSALSYFSPATNRYRYKLETLDSKWHEVGSDQRLASYTTLPAGNYTFRVQGAVSRGVWSEPGASLRIDILPPYWETWWFRVACATLLLALLWFAYNYRLRRIAWQFNVRLEERVDERTRIAREIHDTLMQSFQGSMAQMQAARNLFSRRPEQAGHTLDDAISMAEGAIAESRDAIQDLRSQSAAQHDLAQLLTITGEDLARFQTGGNPATFRVTVEGERQKLDPLLQDETYRIARELLRNAFRHAQARHIEADIRYDERLFRMRIRDDGRGIEAETLQAGDGVGHWGLVGVRERATRIGGQLNFWSGASAGTEVELTIPSSLAYGASRRAGLFQLLRNKAKS